MFRSNPNACVDHLESNEGGTILGRSKLQRQSVRLARQRINGILGVTDEVGQDLEHSMPIAQSRWNRVIASLNLIPSAFEGHSAHGQRLFHQILEADRLQDGPARSCKVDLPTDD